MGHHRDLSLLKILLKNFQMKKGNVDNNFNTDPFEWMPEKYPTCRVWMRMKSNQKNTIMLDQMRTNIIICKTIMLLHKWSKMIGHYNWIEITVLGYRDPKLLMTRLWIVMHLKPMKYAWKICTWECQNMPLKHKKRQNMH